MKANTRNSKSGFYMGWVPTFPRGSLLRQVNLSTLIRKAQGEKTACLAPLLSLVIGLSLLQAIPARADTENDFQQWSHLRQPSPE